MASPPHRWTDAHLDGLRRIADPHIDGTVARIATLGQVGVVNAAWATLRANADPVPPGLPPDVANYLNATATLPAWADPHQIAVGEGVFLKHGPAIVTGLLCASLPIGYSCAPPAQILMYSGRMTHDLRARIDETAQLVFDVAEPGGLGPTGRGIRSCQKIRMIHALIRHRVRAETDYDVARFGAPINQEDLAATMLAFGHITAWVIETLGATLSDAEREGWLHLWRVVGALLGIQPNALPTGADDCAALYREVLRRHQRPTAAGRELTLALLAHVRSYIPGRFDDAVFAELMRTFLTDPIADGMSVPRRRWARGILAADRALRRVGDRATDRSPALRWAAGRFNLHLLRALHRADRRGKRVDFRLPASLLRPEWLPASRSRGR